MTLKDTVPYMESDSFEDQLRAEYYQLCIRIKNLEKTINYTYLSKDYISDTKIGAWTGLLSSMNSYKHALEIRAREEGVIL